MKYYIDFDNTIFDTVSFYNDLLDILYDNGVTKEYVEEYYQNNRMNPLELINSIDNVEIRNKALNHFNDTSKYIYPDAITFLKNKNDKVFILYTHGYLEYQNKKIEGSKILSYFDDLIVTEEDKTALDIDYQNSIFVDDNTKVLKSLIDKQAYRIYRIKRKNNHHSEEVLEDNQIIEIFNMNEIRD